MQVMIRCKVRPDGAEASLELLREVYEEMRPVQPKGRRYATFRLEDKVTQAEQLTQRHRIQPVG